MTISIQQIISQLEVLYNGAVSDDNLTLALKIKELQAKLVGSAKNTALNLDDMSSEELLGLITQLQ